MRPAGFEEGVRYPVLLNIHGGPFTQYTTRFFDEFHVLAGAGYAVVYCNPRGSSGYSEEWGRAIRGPDGGGPGWGSVDYDDLMAVTDEALSRFCVLRPRPGRRPRGLVRRVHDLLDRRPHRPVQGGLLGARGQQHDRRRRLERHRDLVQGLHRHALVRGPGDAPASCRPPRYAQNITTPLLIVHSEDDLRCPVVNAEELFTILRILGREVEFVRFPAEGHELSRSGKPRHRVQRFEILIDWFDRYLK